MLEYIEAVFVGELSAMFRDCCLDGYISCMDGGRSSVSKFYFFDGLVFRRREVLDF